MLESCVVFISEFALNNCQPGGESGCSTASPLHSMLPRLETRAHAVVCSTLTTANHRTTSRVAQSLQNWTFGGHLGNSCQSFRLNLCFRCESHKLHIRTLWEVCLCVSELWGRIFMTNKNRSDQNYLQFPSRVFSALFLSFQGSSISSPFLQKYLRSWELLGGSVLWLVLCVCVEKS